MRYKELKARLFGKKNKNKKQKQEDKKLKAKMFSMIPKRTHNLLQKNYNLLIMVLSTMKCGKFFLVPYHVLVS